MNMFYKISGYLTRPSSRRIASTLSVVVTMALGGCASAPKQDVRLAQIEASFDQLGKDPRVQGHAEAEIQLARQAVHAFKAARSGGEAERVHLAYLADKRIDLAYTAANREADEATLAALQAENARILIEASQRDAEMARLEAEKLRLQSLARAEEIERARDEAVVLAEGRDASLRDAEMAREEADAARRLAEAQSKEAALARREADLAAQAAESLRIQLNRMEARRESRGMVLTLEDIAFESGEAKLREAAAGNLSKVVEFLARYPDRPAVIEGHTDSRGDDNFNQVLSQRRAEAVRDALVAEGVDPKRLQAIGLGESAPVAANDTAEGRAKNRRVDIIVDTQ